MISQGTVSVLVGCHSPIHSILVLMAWYKLYRKWPKPWQIVCIFLHDIGHWGKNYLDDYEQKKNHWKQGAHIAGRLFGWDGYYLVASHDVNSVDLDKDSPLYRSDKYSWVMAPYWWQWSNCVFEPNLRMGHTIKAAIKLFQNQVKKSINTEKFAETHSFYINRCKKD